MQIRRLQAGDVEAILAIFDLVADELLYIGTEPGYDRERKRRRILASFGNDEEPAFVALDGDAIVGSLSVHADDCGPSVGMLIALPYRRRGFGRALVRAADAWARERRVPYLYLKVFPHNAAAIALYRASGFVEIKRFERDVTRKTGDVWDTILMRKPTR